MANSSEMDSGIDIRNVLGPVIGLIVEITLGLFFNVFILSVIFYDFYRQKTMCNSNKIMASLGISNVIYNIVMSAGLLDEISGLPVSSTYDLCFFYIILLLYSVCSCAWLTASLGAFYFIKISQIRLLSWIKFHLRSIVPWMLLVLEVVSFINSSFTSLLLIPSQTSYQNITASPPSVMAMLAESKSRFITAVLCVTSIPLPVAAITTVCTAWTLRRHSLKMKRSIETIDNGHLTSYLRVVRRMTNLFLFYGIFYVLLIVLYFSVTEKMDAGIWMTVVQMSCFTPVQSALLIFGNPRLRNVLKDMMRYLSLTRLLYAINEGRIGADCTVIEISEPVRIKPDQSKFSKSLGDSPPVNQM